MVNAEIPSGMPNGRHAVHKRFENQKGRFIMNLFRKRLIWNQVIHSWGS